MANIIGFSGSDGSGKTTVALELARRLKEKGYKVTYHHELDFIILKPLFRLIEGILGPPAKTAKHQLLADCEVGRPLVSDLYYLAIFADNMISFLWYKIKPGVVVHDRWAYDFTTFFDHKNYNYLSICNK